MNKNHTVTDRQLSDGISELQQLLDAPAEQSGVLHEGRSNDCPSAETLALMTAPLTTGANDPLSEEQRGALVDHLGDCEFCQFEVRVALEASCFVDDSSQVRGFPTTEPVSSPSAQRHPWLRVAAAVILVGASVLWWNLRSIEPSVQPSGERAAAVSDGELAPIDGAILSNNPPLFQWPEQAGAASYTLLMYNSAAEPLWESAPTSEASHVPTPSELLWLSGDKSYMWEVRVGGRVAREVLGPFWFSVQAPRASDKESGGTRTPP